MHDLFIYYDDDEQQLNTKHKLCAVCGKQARRRRRNSSLRFLRFSVLSTLLILSLSLAVWLAQRVNSGGGWWRVCLNVVAFLFLILLFLQNINTPI